MIYCTWIQSEREKKWANEKQIKQKDEKEKESNKESAWKTHSSYIQEVGHLLHLFYK